jgi:hypothetical protein
MSCKFLRRNSTAKKMPEAKHKMGILLPKFNSARKSQSAQTKVANSFHGDTLQLGKSIN